MLPSFSSSFYISTFSILQYSNHICYIKYCYFIHGIIFLLAFLCFYISFENKKGKLLYYCNFMMFVQSQTKDSIPCFYKEYWHLPEHSQPNCRSPGRLEWKRGWDVYEALPGTPLWRRGWVCGKGCAREGGAGHHWQVAVSVCCDCIGFDVRLSLGSRSCYLG